MSDWSSDVVSSGRKRLLPGRAGAEAGDVDPGYRLVGVSKCIARIEAGGFGVRVEGLAMTGLVGGGTAVLPSLQQGCVGGKVAAGRALALHPRAGTGQQLRL